MSPTIRVREPINVYPPEFTVEFYAVMGDGCWCVLENGNIRSTHTWKWQANRRAKQLRAAQNQDTDPAKRPT